MPNRVSDFLSKVDNQRLLTKNEITELWSTAAIAIDTSILCNFYEYSSSTVNEVFGALRAMGDRCWLPHQVVMEFTRQRESKISGAESQYDKANKEARKLLELTRATSRHPHVKSADRRIVSEAVDAICNTFDMAKSEVSKLRKHDWILEAIDNVFGSRVGPEPTAAMIQEWQAEGARRAHLKSPPGYLDSGKLLSNRFGDLFIWMQMMDHCKEHHRGLIFITNDRKEDWWDDDLPRSELRDEFRAATANECHFYTLDHFVKQAKDRGLAPSVSPETISETSPRQYPLKIQNLLSEAHTDPLGVIRKVWHRLANVVGAAESILTSHQPEGAIMRGKYAIHGVLSQGDIQIYQHLRDFVQNAPNIENLSVTRRGEVFNFIVSAMRMADDVVYRFNLNDVE